MSDFTKLAEQYIAAWNETDPSARRALIGEIWSEDGRYLDPLAQVEGRDQIDAVIAAAQAQFAGIDQEEARRRRVQVSTIRDLQYGAGDRSRLMKDILGQLAEQRIAPLIGQTFSLAEAAKAHEAIEARRTVAKTLLLTE